MRSVTGVGTLETASNRATAPLTNPRKAYTGHRTEEQKLSVAAYEPTHQLDSEKRGLALGLLVGKTKRHS